VCSGSLVIVVTEKQKKKLSDDAENNTVVGSKKYVEPTRILPLDARIERIGYREMGRIATEAVTRIIKSAI